MTGQRPDDRSVRAPSDLDLIEAARVRDQEAVDGLYRRHRSSALRLARELADPTTADDIVAEAFVRVLEAIWSGKGPTVAFRPYLLTTVRNAYISHVRRNRALVWVEDYAQTESAGEDAIEQRQESRLLADAFSTLPERWQLVLWHSAVEGDDHRAIGRLLGIKANAVAALAFRAREGLRRAYLAAHLATTNDEDCRETRQQLPEYARGRLRGMRREPIEQHLNDCHRCVAAFLELQALNSDLGAILAPALLGAAGAAYVGRAGLAGASGAGATPSIATVHGPSGRWSRPTGRAGAVAGAVAVAAAVAVAGCVLLVSQLIDGDLGGTNASASQAPAGRPGPADPAPPVEAPTSRPPLPTPHPTATSAARPTLTPGPRATTPVAPSTTPTSGPNLFETPQQPDPSDSTPTPAPTSTPTPATTPTPTTSPGPQPTEPTEPTEVPSSPTTGPTPARTTADLGLASPSHTDYGAHQHLQMVVTAPIDPTTVAFDIDGLISYSVHRDLDFASASCATSSGVADLPTLTCSLPAGTGIFAVDLVVEGSLAVSARVYAPDNDDPDPTNDTVLFD